MPHYDPEPMEAPTLKDFGGTLVDLVCMLVLIGGLVLAVLVSSGALVIHNRHWLGVGILVVTLAGVRGWRRYYKHRDD